MAANVHHSSPQRTTHGKRSKSTKKTQKRIDSNRLVLLKFL